MDMSIKNQTFDLIYDYALFRLHNSEVKKNKLGNFPLPNPSYLAKKMRYLVHKFSGDVTTWHQLTDQRDFSISNFEEFVATVQSGFDDCQIDAQFIYAYVEYLGICAVCAVSTSIFGANVKDICQYGAEYLCNSTKFMKFLFQENGWEGFLNRQYSKKKCGQVGMFKQWLQVLNNQECL